MSDEGLPPVEEWPDWSENPLGANPMEQDINAPYNKVSTSHLDDFEKKANDLIRVI